MRWSKSLLATLFLLAIATPIAIWSAQSAHSQSAGDPVVQQILPAEFSAFRANVENLCADASDAQKTHARDLLDRQQQALATAQSHLATATPTRARLNSELSHFFSYGDQAINACQGGAGIVATGRSDGPHNCSNHCYESCGYNSLGELICYNRCVRCCNNGGC